MISASEAASIAKERASKDFGRPLVADPDVIDAGEHFVVSCGDARFINDDDLDYMDPDVPFYFVAKRDGSVFTARPHQQPDLFRGLL